MDEHSSRNSMRKRKINTFLYMIAQDIESNVLGKAWEVKFSIYFK